ncbi:MAG TPA: hypothetical protein VL547_23550 [Dinghuibacter sp.]|jgi:hypothetical protein|uniref:hypothetical protein n=1 Tax=Dinghuibacter sp. TaxID=2024697 RepID=UPI002BAC0005|nr:hypothetical protein [Dinghuibacter sp.]HTJ15042.1 hypothetical protein [Dinghuibacter sp.]
MNFEFTHLLPNGFSPESRVWIYQSSRPFTLSEALEIEDILNGFTASWQTHGEPVKGYANLLFGQFIVLMADTTVSGCSTDSSVRVIKDIEQRFAVNLFDRLALAFVVRDKIQLVPMSQLDYAIKQGFINADTIYFNNIVPSKEEMLAHWMIPVRDSWLAKRFLPDLVK